MSSDDRTPDSVPGEPAPEQPTVVIPEDTTVEQGTPAEAPRWEGTPAQGPDGVAASAAEPVVGPAPRSRWSRARGAVRRPRTHRGRVVLTAAAAAALLLVGGGIGLAVGAGVGHDGGGRGHSSSSQDGGGRGDHGDGRGDGAGDGQGGRGDDGSSDDRNDG